MTYVPPELPPWDHDRPEHRALIEKVHRYRSAGWFAHSTETDTDEKTAQAARQTWWSDFGCEMSTDFDDGIFICIADPSRAIWFDPEADVCEGNSSYVHFLAQLSSLTEGDASIGEVVEDWHTEPGRIFVTYKLNGDEHSLALHHYDDWVDPKVLEQLNDELPAGGRRFYCFDGGGQPYALTWATADEVGAIASPGTTPLLDRAPDGWPGVR